MSNLIANQPIKLFRINDILKKERKTSDLAVE